MASRRTRKSRRVEDNYLQVSLPEAREASFQNPMLIDVILDNMFGFCDFETLGQCRRVSKQWHKDSLPTWLAKGPTLKLHFNRQPLKRKEGHYEEFSMNMNMTPFLRVVHNEFHSYGPYEYAGLRQYKRLEVEGDAAHPIPHHYLQQFFRVHGHFITELTLMLAIPDFYTYRAIMLSTMTPNLVKLVANITVADAQDGDAFKHGANELVPETHRQLTSLQIDDYSFGIIDDDSSPLSGLPVTGWIQLLKRYPNLKVLLLNVECEVEVTLVDRMLEAIGTIRQSDKKLLDLRHLKICLFGSDDVLQPTLLRHFRNAQLSMETLEMTLLGEDSQQHQTIAELLSSQAATLKSLSIDKADPMSSDFSPPAMPLLHSLRLHGYPIPNLDSLKNFHNLKSLSFSASVSNVTNAGFPHAGRLAQMLKRGAQESLSLPTLSKLEFYSGHHSTVHVELGRQAMRRLAGVFPNLRDLQMRLNNDGLAAVVQGCWPDLQQLTVVGNGVDDTGISGVVGDLPKMQALKSLVMRQYDYDYNYVDALAPTALTEQSLSNFLKLPNLERLEISLGEQESVRAATLRKLEEKIKSLKITWARKLTSDESDDSTSDSD